MTTYNDLIESIILKSLKYTIVVSLIQSAMIWALLELVFKYFGGISFGWKFYVCVITSFALTLASIFFIYSFFYNKLMSTSSKHRVSKNLYCPHCGYEYEAANFDKDPPTVGDLSICICCYAINKFMCNEYLEKANLDDLDLETKRGIRDAIVLFKNL